MGKIWLIIKLHKIDWNFWKIIPAREIWTKKCKIQHFLPIHFVDREYKDTNIHTIEARLLQWVESFHYGTIPYLPSSNCILSTPSVSFRLWEMRKLKFDKNVINRVEIMYITREWNNLVKIKNVTFVFHFFVVICTCVTSLEVIISIYNTI